MIMAWLRAHPWRRRFLGLGIGLLMLVTFEGICRLAGWGRQDPLSDPFVSFEGTVPLFSIDPLTNTFVTSPQRQKFFVEDRFPRTKPAGTYRVFCLGGSTVQGRPYSIETSFGAWLRLSMKAAYPDRRFEVVNCGGVSYASYRLIPILTECLNYDPDLLIVCTGQNEFLEERTYAREKRWRRAHAIASHLRLYHLLRRLTPGRGPVASRPILKGEVDALLDYRGGLELYKRDDRWRRGVEEHFRSNLVRLITPAKNASVPVLFLRPPVNLKDCPPFKSSSAPAPKKDPQPRDKDDIGEAIRLLKRAIAADERQAMNRYLLGQLYLSQANYREAEAHLWRALEEDLCPLRLLPSMAADLKSICANQRVPCLDLQSLLGRECPQGLIGHEILLDHIHPSIRGHQLIARALLDQLEPRLGARSPGWERRRKEAYQAHLDHLDPLYYTHGQQRLQNLHLWTQGRADGPPIHRRSQPLSQ